MLGDRGGEHLQADHEPGLRQRRLGERGVGQVTGVDAADQQPREPLLADRGEDAGGVQARGRRDGRGVERPAGGDVGARGGVVDGPATRQERRQGAGLDGAALPRTAGGPQATRAPVARASSSTAVSAPGTSASRSPTRTTAPGRRIASTAGPPQLPSASARSERASAPGGVVSTVARSFCAARVANG
ncbi:hypothetical protein, partial [Blastococcus sp. CCUG 61487]|uniref:hypothetical protein n=1 Tax=Blastococcus sp. CCUG 61487 TaxID=1840703 RepID=UPI0032E49021